MKVRSLEQSAERWQQHTMRAESDWIEGSIRAYLDGTRTDPGSLEWIAGMVHASGDIAAAAETLSRLNGYGSAERYEALRDWFDSGAPISVLRKFQPRN